MAQVSRFTADLPDALRGECDRFMSELPGGHGPRMDALARDRAAIVQHGLDTALANACLDYLNYDRCGISAVYRYLPGGSAQLESWLADFHIEPVCSP